MKKIERNIEKKWDLQKRNRENRIKENYRGATQIPTNNKEIIMTETRTITFNGDVVTGYAAPIQEEEPVSQEEETKESDDTGEDNNTTE